MFEFLAYLVWVWIEGHDDARLTREDTTRESDGGNRCKLSIRQALVAVLVAKKTGDPVTDLAGRFLLDPVTVARYVEDYDKMLNEILPTADGIEEIIRGRIRREGEADSVVSGTPGTRRPTRRIRRAPAPTRWDAGDEAADPADPEGASPDPLDAGDEAARPGGSGGRQPPTRLDAGDEAADPADPERSGPDPYLVDIPPWQILNRAVALSYMQTPPPVGITGLPVSEGPTPADFSPRPGPVRDRRSAQHRRVRAVSTARHVRVESSSDREWNRLTYAGKVKRHSYNKNYYVDPGGLYIGKSPAVPGSMHDFRLLKENLAQVRVVDQNNAAQRPAGVGQAQYCGGQGVRRHRQTAAGSPHLDPRKDGRGFGRGRRALPEGPRPQQGSGPGEVHGRGCRGPDQAVRRNERARTAARPNSTTRTRTYSRAWSTSRRCGRTSRRPTPTTIRKVTAWRGRG